MITLAIDPSVRSIGAAVFEGRALTCAARVLVPEAPRGTCHGMQAEWAAAQAVAWFAERSAFPPDVVVYEWPQVYVDERSKGDRNDLPGLAAVGAAIVAHLRERAWLLHREVHVQTYSPAEWAGQTKKLVRDGGKWRRPRVKEAWLTARAKWIARALNAAELELSAGANHDAVDAVGIGLHHVGRLRELRVLPGASPG